MPRVSVIVPAFNASASIEETLTSVAAQTFRDWEVVVADDGSTDDTAALAAAVDARVTVVQTIGRLGPAGARNAAIAHARGDLIAFLDADDLWLPEFLEEQVGLFDRETARTGGPPVGIVACDARIRTAEGDRTQSFLDQFPGGHDPLTLESQLRRNRIYISAVVARDAGDEVGWFDTGLFGTEDHDLWIRILETGRRAVLNPKALAIYRHVAGSVSSDLARQAENDQRTYRHAVARGRLTPEQRRIAEREIRYHEVRGAVAEAWFGRRPAALLRQIPAAAGVVVTNPGRWRDWVHALSGRRL